jgi:hypothetical protein
VKATGDGHEGVALKGISTGCEKNSYAPLETQRRALNQKLRDRSDHYARQPINGTALGTFDAQDRMPTDRTVWGRNEPLGEA